MKWPEHRFGRSAQTHIKNGVLLAMKFKPLLLIALGVSLLVVGLNMRAAQNRWTTQEEIPGTKGTYASIGAGVGAGGGGILAAIVGGIGIVACGTGIGLPAGLLLIGSVAVGAGAGAVTGAAMGTSATTISVTHVEPAYQTWHWVLVVGAGVLLLVWSVFEVKKAVPPAKTWDTHGS